MKLAPLPILALSSFLAACGSDDGSSPTQTGGPQTPNASDPCGLNSGWPGDDLCILPPAAGEGIQLHVGPKSYSDQAELEPYLLEPGKEDVRCFLARIPEGGFYYLRQENR